MALNAFENIDQRLNLLDNREIKMTERELVLEIPLSEQNERFEKLRKGYVSLKLIENEVENEFKPLTRDLFLQTYNDLNIKYNVLSEVDYKKEEYRDNIEQYLVELIPLIQNRWNSICGYKRLWKSRRLEIRQKVFNLFASDLKELSEEINNNDQSKWLEKANLTFLTLDKLIKDEEDLLTTTESLQTELEELFKQREEIFVIAHNLFAM